MNIKTQPILLPSQSYTQNKCFKAVSWTGLIMQGWKSFPTSSIFNFFSCSHGFGMQALETGPKNHNGHTDWEKPLRGIFSKWLHHHHQGPWNTGLDVPFRNPSTSRIDTAMSPLQTEGQCLCLYTSAVTENDLVQYFKLLLLVISQTNFCFLNAGSRVPVALRMSCGERKLNFSPTERWSFFLWAHRTQLEHISHGSWAFHKPSG